MPNNNDYKRLDQRIKDWIRRHQKGFYDQDFWNWITNYLNEKPLFKTSIYQTGTIREDLLIDYYNHTNCDTLIKDKHFLRMMNAWRAHKQKQGKYAYSILLSPETHQLFEELQRELQVNKSKIFEDAIIEYHKKKVSSKKPRVRP